MKRNKLLATLLAASMLLGVAPNLPVHAGLSQVGDTAQSNTTVKLEKTADPTSVIVSIPAEVTISKKTINLNDTDLKEHLFNGITPTGSYDWYYPQDYSWYALDKYDYDIFDDNGLQSVVDATDKDIYDVVDTISFSGNIADTDALYVKYDRDSSNGSIYNSSATNKYATLAVDLVRTNPNVHNAMRGGTTFTYFYATAEDTFNSVPVTFAISESDAKKLAVGKEYTATVVFEIDVLDKTDARITGSEYDSNPI